MTTTWKQQQMTTQLPPHTEIERLVRHALSEDIGDGDITAQLIPAGTLVNAKIIARERGVLCGRAWADEVFRQLDQSVSLTWVKQDAEHFEENQVLVEIRGDARTIMTAERSALNFLQTLSAVATQTANFLKLVSHTGVSILDTRKTLPGMRTAQKYAVRSAGGKNHRMGLYDAFLIKENHIAACGGISAAVESARRLAPGKPVEVEVRNLDELRQALQAQADTVMLDNFTLSDLRTAIDLNSGRSTLEASGGISADTLVKIAETGVDCISIGALTKHCHAIDLSLLIE